MGLTTGRRPVPDYLDPKQNCIIVRTPSGKLEVMAVHPKPPPPLALKLWEGPAMTGGLLTNYFKEVHCKEQFCSNQILPDLNRYPTYYHYPDFCSFDCEMWHEALCK